MGTARQAITIWTLAARRLEATAPDVYCLLGQDVVPVEVFEESEAWQDFSRHHIGAFHLIGAAAVPVVLISFGMSLHGTRPLAPGSARRDVILASTLKLTLMPLAAWLVGGVVFGLSGHRLFAVVVLAALPAAQNVFNYAQRYDRGVILARDVVLITTALSLPVLLVIAALLAPAG